jgi:hypothetical protein
MGLTLLKPIMPPETRMLFSFCFGSLGQRFLLAVGFSLPTAHAQTAR